jgi:hypothetical protein
MMTVEYHPAIEREIKEIRDFYEGRAPGLGGEFVEELEREEALARMIHSQAGGGCLPLLKLAVLDYGLAGGRRTGVMENKPKIAYVHPDPRPSLCRRIMVG